MKIPDKTGDKQASEVRFSTWPEGKGVVVFADGSALIGGSTIVDAPGQYGGRSSFDLAMLPFRPGGALLHCQKHEFLSGLGLPMSIYGV